MIGKAVSRRLWLVRHGMRQDFVQPDWRESAARPDDTPLSAEGRQQAHETGLYLKGKGVEVIYSSPFLRAVETAAGVAAVLDVPIRIEEGLCEVLKAEWFSGQPDFLEPTMLQADFPAIDTSYVTKVRPRYPEGEENGELGARCRETLTKILEDDWSGALLVGHGASVGGIGGALVGHCRDVCFKMCGLTGWAGVQGCWATLYSGVGHLSYTEEDVRFH